MKRDQMDRSAVEAQATSTIDDETLSTVRGGLAVGTVKQPRPRVGQSVYEYMEALGNYFDFVNGGMT